MESLEKRISALEVTHGAGPWSHLSQSELDALFDKMLAGIGTSLAQEVAKYGSEEAFFTALHSGQCDFGNLAEPGENQ